MKVLLVSPDPQLRTELSQGIHLGWGLDVAYTGEEALGSVVDLRPDLVVADQELPGMSGLEFLDALARRLDPPPATVLVVSSEVDDGTRVRALALKVQEVLARPVDEEAVQRIYAPYRIEDGPPNMSLLEFLATGYADMDNRLLELTSGGQKVSLVFGVGYLWAVLHPLFRDRYRSALEGAGFTLPPPDDDGLLDEAAIEELLGPSPQLAALKHHTVQSILASMPLHQTFHGRLSEVMIPEGLIPLDVPAIMVSLVDQVPESALSVLRAPGVKLSRRLDVIPADLPILPHHGYLLSVCETPTTVGQLIQVGSVPPQQILSGIYLLLLLGLLVSEPPVDPPFRLAGLQREMEQEGVRQRRQVMAIQGLVHTFQMPGRSPYDILGIPPTATPKQIIEAFQLLMERLSPKSIRPEVFKSHRQDIMYLQAKLNEALLLLQSSQLVNKRLGQGEGDTAQDSVPGEGVFASEPQAEIQRKEAEKLVAMARQMLVDDNPYDAGQCLKLAILYDPNHAAAHHLMGKVYRRQNDRRSTHMAERKFLEALRLDPRNIEVHLDLIELYLSQGLMVRCRACLARAQRMDPRHPRVLELREMIKAKDK